MFRPMRRSAQAIPTAEAERILATASSGVLALAGDDGYPYALPISYVYADGKLYFHSATTGHKIDAIRRCDRASFCVIDRDDVVPEQLTTKYRSVIAFGRIRLLDDPDEMRTALRILAAKYAPGLPTAPAEAEIRDALPAGRRPSVAVFALTIEHLTGKEGRLLAAERAQ